MRARLAHIIAAPDQTSISAPAASQRTPRDALSRHAHFRLGDMRARPHIFAYICAAHVEYCLACMQTSYITSIILYTQKGVVNLVHGNTRVVLKNSPTDSYTYTSYRPLPPAPLQGITPCTFSPLQYPSLNPLPGGRCPRPRVLMCLVWWLMWLMWRRPASRMSVVALAARPPVRR